MTRDPAGPGPGAAPVSRLGWQPALGSLDVLEHVIKRGITLGFKVTTGAASATHGGVWPGHGALPDLAGKAGGPGARRPRGEGRRPGLAVCRRHSLWMRGRFLKPEALGSHCRASHACGAGPG